MRARHAATQGLLAVADQAIVSLTSFAAIVLIRRSLGEEPLGIFSLGMATFWLLAGVPNALVWTPYASRAPGLGHAARQSYAWSAHWQAMSLGIAGGLACLAIAAGAFTVRGGPDWLAPFFACLAVMVVLMSAREHVRRHLIAEFRGANLLAFDAVVCVVQLAMLLGLWGAGWLTAYSALVALAAGSALSLAWFPWRQTRPADRARRAHAAVNWSFGRWLLLVSLAWLCSDAVVRWMLVGMHGPATLGEFAEAYAIVMLGNPVIVSMGSFARAYAARVYAADGLRGLAGSTLRWTLLSVIAAAVALAFFYHYGSLLVSLVFGIKFTGGAILVAAALAVCLQGMTIPAEAALTALRDGKWMTRIAIIRLATTVSIGAPLIYYRGAYGVALTMAVHNAVALALHWAAVGLHVYRESLTTGEAPAARPTHLPSVSA